MTKPGGSLCAVDGCRSNKKRNPNLSFFHLPANEESRKTWLKVIGRPDLDKPETKIKSHFVCSLHFDPSAIKYTPHLRPNTVPTKFLPSEDGPAIFTASDEPRTKDSSTQTTEDVSSDKRKLRRDSDDSTSSTASNESETNSSTQTVEITSSNTGGKRKLRNDSIDSSVKRSKIENDLDAQSDESAFQSAFKHFALKSEDEYKLEQWRSWSIKEKNKGKHNLEYKLFALNFYISSPSAYRRSMAFLSLPSEKSLHNFKIVIPVEIENRTLDFISSKLKSLPEEAKYCTLCVGEMEIKQNLHHDLKKDEIIGLHNINGDVMPELASHVYVIMLQGIVVNWVQPIAYSFLGSPEHYEKLEPWIDEVVLKLSNLGVDVKAIVSEEGSNFDKYAKKVKKITKEKPFYLLNDKKIYYIFDVLRLITGIWNVLMENDLLCGDKKISWEYIKSVYSRRKQKSTYVSRITQAHITPDSLQKTRVKYAAQIFSNSVQSALNVFISKKILPEEAKATADFVGNMNNLFDILTSNTGKTAMCVFQKPYSFEKDQLDLLEAAMTTFSQVKAIDKRGVDNTNSINTFEHFQITIQSIMMLCNDLKEDGIIDKVFTRRLTQECLENFLCTVSQQGGRYPTAIVFQRVFSRHFLSNMLKNLSQADREEDVCEYLEKHKDFLERSDSNPVVRSSTYDGLSDESDYRFDLPTENALEYLSAYLFYKCSRVADCPKFTSELKNTPSFNDFEKFHHFKDLNKDSHFYGQLKVPSNVFCSYVNELETAFIKLFVQSCGQKPGSTIYGILKEIPFKPPCPCFPQDYLVRLFIRFRTYSTVKFNNDDLTQGQTTVHKTIKLKQLL